MRASLKDYQQINIYNMKTLLAILLVIGIIMTCNESGTFYPNVVGIVIMALSAIKLSRYNKEA